MSKIVFFCIPAQGHTNPTLGVVKELVSRGHEVYYYSYNMLREKIEEAGAKFVSCDEYDMEQKLSPADGARIGKEMAFSIKILVDTTLALDDKIKADMEKLKPDCIVADSMAVWGKAAALKYGIPFVSSTTTFAFNKESAKKYRKRNSRRGFEMKVVIVNGQNHKGSTRMIARELAEKITTQEEITEFFLPRDFDKPCIGCWTCFRSDLTHCPHYAQLEPLATAMDEADVILLASPVYVYHATGQMMAFLDHFGTQWIVHRPKEIMFQKQAVSICTAAGGGMKSTCKDMADSLNFWGIPKVYKLGLGIRASAPDGIPDSVMEKIHRKTDSLAQKIKANQNPKSPSLFGRFWFSLIRFGHKHMPPVEPDYSYWEERGWHGKNRPWK